MGRERERQEEKEKEREKERKRISLERILRAEGVGEWRTGGEGVGGASF